MSSTDDRSKKMQHCSVGVGGNAVAANSGSGSGSGFDAEQCTAGGVIGSTSGRRSLRKQQRRGVNAIARAEHHDETLVESNISSGAEEEEEKHQDETKQSPNKLVHTALELAWSLFGPNTTVVKTLQMSRAHRNGGQEPHSLSSDVTFAEYASPSDEDSASLKEDVEGSCCRELRHLRRCASDSALFVHSNSYETALNGAISSAYGVQFSQLQNNPNQSKNFPSLGDNFCGAGERTAEDSGITDTAAKKIGRAEAAAAHGDAFAKQKPNKIHAQLKTATNTLSKSLTDQTRNGDGDKDSEQSIRERHRELVEEYFQHCADFRHPRLQIGRRDQTAAATWQDRYYYEYHQYLCKVWKEIIQQEVRRDPDDSIEGDLRSDLIQADLKMRLECF
ncbi:unnamed protein product [Anisakis simplex]|uniref:Uncharacterized protein n=1 Tax=Anisakis simplex TaxID=6269 RepID=A0A0M3K6L3_ANISI|nr:unnamed protein product [Anisakis simplex]